MILTDDAAGVRAAVEHLVDCGYRRIAYVEGEGGASNALREATVAATLRSRGVRHAATDLPRGRDAWRAPGALAAEIAADPPEALVCYDDKLALALMDALRPLGIRVPGDVGIVGFDGIPFTAISNPRLTTVATPAGEMGRLAAASLIRAIREGTPPEGSRPRAGAHRAREHPGPASIGDGRPARRAVRSRWADSRRREPLDGSVEESHHPRPVGRLRRRRPDRRPTSAPRAMTCSTTAASAAGGMSGRPATST